LAQKKAPHCAGPGCNMFTLGV